MNKPEYYKINSEHIAIVKINEQTQKAELDYIQIEKFDDDVHRQLEHLVNIFFKYYTQIKEKSKDRECILEYEQTIEILKEMSCNIEYLLINNDALASLSRAFDHCVCGKNYINESRPNNQTYYGSTYDGLKKIEFDLESKVFNCILKFNEDLMIYKNKEEENFKTIFKERKLNNYPSIEELQNDQISRLCRLIYSFCENIMLRKGLAEHWKTIWKYCYNNTNKYIKAYSNKRVGFGKYNFNIGNEYKAIIDINLGYGSASFFLLIISYKGIKLTPYSKYVNYYFANKNELHRYTKQAFLYDSEWGVLFQYVVDTYNLALANPTELIDKYFIGELNQMVVGLEKIARTVYPKEYYIINETEVYVATKTNKELEFKIDSIEFEYFQLEKISGALEFVESIERIKEISDVQKYIDRIIAVNKKILSSSNRKLKQLENEIPILKYQIKEKSKILNSLNTSLKQLIDNKIEVIVNGEYSNLELKNIYLSKYKCDDNSVFEGKISKFSKNLLTILANILLKNEGKESQYNQLKSEITHLEDELSELNSKLTDTESWIPKFEDGISIIENYFDANSIS